MLQILQRKLNQKQMKKIFLSTTKILVVLWLVCIVSSQDYIDATPVQQVDQPTVVEANHYYSSQQKSVNYNIVSLNKGLPVFIIPKNQHAKRADYANKVNLTLNDNQGNYVLCTLQDNYELCVLQKFTSDALSMIIQCESLPCEFSWIVLQTPIQKIDTKSLQQRSLKQLYQIQQSQQNKHLTIKVTCQSEQLQKSFHQELQFYANRQNYHKVKTQGISYFLLNNPPNQFKQYFYLRIDQKYNQCAKIQIFNQQSNINPGSKDKSTVVTDFVFKATPLIYSIQSPAKDMRLDAGVHLYTDQAQLQGQFSVKVAGNLNGVYTIIRKMSLQVQTKKHIQFSLVLNNITSDYTNLQLTFQSSLVDSIINFQLVSGEIQEIQKGQYSFFSLKKGQKVKYKIIQQKQAEKGQKTFIFSSNENSVKLSKKQCDAKSGCQFQLQASEDLDGSIYIGQSKKQNKQEVVKFQIQKSFTKRVHEDAKVYLRKKVQEKKHYQIVVNTHNVILYAASQDKCKQPSQSCHEKVGNSQHPFIYESAKKEDLLITVHALDETQFTVTIIEEDGEYPQLQDGVPFTYLMDDAEEQIMFKFNLPEKEDLTFSLIAPLDQLVLFVFNSENLPKNYKDNTQLYTSDGYVYFEKSQIKSKQFYVGVKKLDPSIAQYAHFTLIASTKNANIKLESGVTHHQKLKQNEHQDFVTQFDPKKKYVISFYIHNAVGQKINVSLQLSKNDTYDKNTKQNSFTIDRQVDEIDISLEGEKVCKSEGSQSCEVFLRIQNKMGKDIDLQLTLLSKNSIVQLHDGIWQYFPQQLTSTTANFYFFPKNVHSPITIIYQSNNPDLRLLYSLVKMDSQTINPESWQFPSVKNQANKLEQLNLQQRQAKHFSIGKDALKSCSPNCLVLMTLVTADTIKGEFSQVDRDKQFGILISNKIIEIPQKTKVEVVLEKGDQKYLKMSLRTVLQHDTLTTYIYTTLGSTSIYANVCSQKNIRMPSKEQFDFSFGILETQLRTQTIKRKFSENQIDEEENPYLCLIAVSDESTRFSIQFTSEQQIISLLSLDQFKTVATNKKQSKYFQVQASVEHTIKIVRNKGFPFIQQKKCTGKDVSYEQCLSDLQEQDEQKKFQLVEKIKRYQYEPCEKCIVYIKISSLQPAEIDIHLQSKYTEITLQQKKIITDYLQINEQNRYQLTALSDQPTYVNVNVIDGNIRCKVSDLNSIEIQKSSDSKSRVLHFAITPQQFSESKSSLTSKSNLNPSSSLLSSFGLEDLFATLHISIQSTDREKGSSYTIQYSSGERQSYLQDGIVYKYNLQANNNKSPAKFYYQNFDQNSHLYIFLGTKKSSELSSLEINVYQMESENDQESKQQINSKIPELRKKTVKPTVLYPLPTAKFYSIQVSNPTGSLVQLSIGVNHQQVLFLPYDIDYPFPLSNHESVNFIVAVQSKGYVLLTLKKCDQSNADISYTFDYEGFKQGQYQYTTTLNNDPKFQYLIKIKQPGPLYVNIIRNQPEGISSDAQFKTSIFSLNAKFGQQKMKTSDYLKAGNKGLMTYEILSSDKIKISFTQVTCQSKSDFCSSKFQYFLVASDKMVDVYSQSVCPSTYFAEIQNSQKHPVLPLRKILQKANSNHTITFEYQFEKSNPISYIAVKGIYKNKENESIEVYYQPIEVVTLWGQLQKASSNHGIQIGVGVFVLFCVFLICLRRQKRKGYQSLEQQDR